MTDTPASPVMTVPPDASLLDAARAFARDPVALLAPVWDRERQVDPEAFARAAALGLTGIQVAPEHGGRGLGFATKVAVVEALAAADFGFAMALVNTHNVAALISRLPQPDLARRYLPDLLAARRLGCTALTEPQAGSDFSAIATLATRVDGGWRIDGAKAWITNAAQADVVVLYAQTQPGSGARGIAGFLVDGRRQGFVREVPYALAGQHTVGLGGFRLEGYRALDAELIHPPGRAFKAALGSINQARTYLAAMCCGMVGQCIDIVRRHGEQRQAFGAALASHQGWRWRVAEAATELAAACRLVEHAVGVIEQGGDAQLEAAQAKLFATRMAERQIPVLAQAMGAEGLREQHPFSRHLQGARMASLADGSSEMLLERICALLRAA